MTTGAGGSAGAGIRVLWAPYAQRGSVYPVVPVINALKAAAEILLVGLGSLRSLAESLDIGFQPYRSDIDYDWSRPSGIDRHGLGPAIGPRWFHDRATAECTEILAAVEEFAPDVLLTDSFVTGAGLAAELLDLPWASYVHYLFDESADVDAMHRIWWENPGQSEIRAYRDWWDSVRREAGLGAEQRSPDEAPWYRMSPHRTILLGHPRLRRGHRPLPDYVARTSIPPWDEAASELEPIRLETKRRPTVLVANSATWQDDMALVAAGLDGLACLDLNVMVTIAAHHDIPQSLPPNAHVSGYLSHSSLLPQVDVVVCCAGYGLVSKALWHGVPLVLAPGRRDQPYVADAVVHAGCGVCIGKAPTARIVRDAVDAVLGTARFRDRAQALAGPQPGYPGPGEVARLILDLAGLKTSGKS